MLEETTRVEDVALLRTPVMRDRVTVMDLVMEVAMMAMLVARENSNVAAIIVNSLEITTMRRMTAVRNHD